MFKIRFDACNRITLGLASIGYVIYYEDTILLKHFSIIKDGAPDSNYAEYIALIEALKMAIKLNIDFLQVEGDAKIVINQINKLCNIKSDTVKPLLKKVNKLKNNFTDISFEHIYRKYNTTADSLANHALYSYLNIL